MYRIGERICNSIWSALGVSVCIWQQLSWTSPASGSVVTSPKKISSRTESSGLRIEKHSAPFPQVPVWISLSSPKNEPIRCWILPAACFTKLWSGFGISATRSESLSKSSLFWLSCSSLRGRSSLRTCPTWSFSRDHWTPTLRILYGSVGRTTQVTNISEPLETCMIYVVRL